MHMRINVMWDFRRTPVPRPVTFLHLRAKLGKGGEPGVTLQLNWHHLIFASKASQHSLWHSIDIVRMGEKWCPPAHVRVQKKLNTHAQ